ncbi:alkaline phosphatase family protein [Mycoplasma marinum]|uniref:Metalloenzyme domain-containing protein n=1 Tax=Mycoplasma marinum TaxID=1937190 RepID=A0A4R0XQ64_9MOLU|nr:alkaline phosphatase family protein [Mycoplasma marinum]TCG11015.1 hypothetical protein C4B24_03255 [Mycoplasma marinum]
MNFKFKRILLSLSLITFTPVTAFLVTSCSSNKKSIHNSGKNVLWIGIDGFSANVWKKHPTENIGKLISKSNYSISAKDIMPSKTYPNWTGLLTSQKPDKTGILSNPSSVLGGPIIKNPTPQNNMGKGVAYSIFDAIKDQTKLRTSFIYPLTKGFTLKDIVNPNSVNNMIYAKPNPNELKITKEEEAHLKEKILNANKGIGKFEALKLQVAYTLSKATDSESIYRAADLIIKDKTDFVFSHIAGLDIRGHAFNWGSQEYIDYMNKIDSYIGVVLKRLKESKEIDNTIIVITSDHGGIIGGKTHGGDTPDERTVPIIIFDGSKQKQKKFTNISTLDVAPTIANILGIDKYKEWEGKILKI